jgi:hypothetical protein
MTGRRCGGTFRELANAGEIPEPHTPLIPGRDARCRWRHVISALAPTGLDKAAPLKRSNAMKETLAKEFPTPARPRSGRK